MKFIDDLKRLRNIIVLSKISNDVIQKFKMTK